MDTSVGIRNQVNSLGKGTISASKFRDLASLDQSLTAVYGVMKYNATTANVPDMQNVITRTVNPVHDIGTMC